MSAGLLDDNDDDNGILGPTSHWSKIQWLAEKLDFLSNYFINRVSLNQDDIPSKWFYAIFSKVQTDMIKGS